MDSAPDGPDLRIVIIGKCGTGKSAAGNTILGENRFKAQISFKHVTETCEKAGRRWGNRRISVVDTSGLWGIGHSDDGVKREMVKSLKLSCPGPHVFLLVLRLGRITTEEKDSVEHLQELFGPEVFQYMMVLFTHGDLLEEEDTTIEDGLLSEEQDLQHLIRKCGNRFHVFNNRIHDRCQVVDLIKKIDNMVAGNGGTYYTGNKTVAVRGLQDVVSTLENLQRADSNVSRITSYQVTFNVNLVPTDTNSLIVCRRDGAVPLPSAGPQRLCLQGSSAQILFDIRSSFIEGISGPVLKSLVDKLFEKKVLTDSERESADEMQNKRDKARFVIDTVRRKGEAASSEMIEFLREVDPFLCKHLLI